MAGVSSKRWAKLLQHKAAAAAGALAQQRSETTRASTIKPPHLFQLPPHDGVVRPLDAVVAPLQAQGDEDALVEPWRADGAAAQRDEKRLDGLRCCLRRRHAGGLEPLIEVCERVLSSG